MQKTQNPSEKEHEHNITVKNMKTEIHMKKTLCPAFGLGTGSS
jgi:hypothetical protein